MSDSRPPESTDTPEGGSQSDFPVAQVSDTTAAGRWSIRNHPTRIWWLTGACAVVAVFLFAFSVHEGEEQITVRFRTGHGIKPGDTLRYRGIDVGSVVSTELHPGFESVDVRIALGDKAAGIARDGSRFWIERPQVSLSRFTGLDTIVGANYVAVTPGPPDAPSKSEFDGLESPPRIRDAGMQDITIRFREGHGLAVGDFLRFRSIEVGEVTSLQLNPDLAFVDVNVRLIRSANRLARAGSQFWIERPQLRLTELRGLDTVVGGRYLAVQPGPIDGDPIDIFVGLDQAPAIADRSEGGLEILLESNHRQGLTRGAPVTYRGLEIGRITALGLTSDAVRVEARAYVRAEYRQLVRENARFWINSGVDVSLGITGLRMDVDSLSTLAAGGVALSVPDSRGAPVATGHRFTLHARPEDEWLEWQPSIPLGNSLLPDNSPSPEPLRATLRWNERRFGIRVERQRDAWVLLLDNGYLLAPSSVLAPKQPSLDASPVFAVEGSEFPLDSQTAKRIGPLALAPINDQFTSLPQRFPEDRIRVPAEPENCLLVGDPLGPSFPLSVGRMTSNQASWDIDASLPLDKTWLGAAVIARHDGKLIGMVTRSDNQMRISPVTDAILQLQ